MMKPILETKHLSKIYKGERAVDDVSLSINKGAIYGFLGLNGAGKTTTIRMLLGMIRPTHGSCFIKGRKVSQATPDLFTKVGYMVETPHAYPELTVRENLEIFRRIRLLSDPNAVDRVIQLLKLNPYEHKKAKNLSLGNAQRLGIAKALMHQPEVLLLDEPVNGLDPAGIVEIRELLLDLSGNHGITIFISSHLLSEIAQIATNIGIIHQGRLIQEIESKQLKLLLNQRLIINTANHSSAERTLNKAGVSCGVNKHGNLETYDAKAIEHPDQIARLLVESSHSLTHLAVEKENLEDYFLRMIKEKGETNHEAISGRVSHRRT